MKNTPSKKPARKGVETSSFLLGLFFDPEDGGDMFLGKVGWFSTDYTDLYLRQQNSSR
jgi:hypothetical protein